MSSVRSSTWGYWSCTCSFVITEFAVRRHSRLFRFVLSSACSARPGTTSSAAGRRVSTAPNITGEAGGCIAYCYELSFHHQQKQRTRCGVDYARQTVISTEGGGGGEEFKEPLFSKLLTFIPYTWGKCYRIYFFLPARNQL